MADEKEKAIAEFVERMGLVTQADGLPRIAGRIMGLMIVHGGSFGFTELTERLSVSRASIMMGQFNDRLNEDRHKFIVIDQMSFSAIEKRIGAERAGVDLFYGGQEMLQAFGDGALVGKEDALIFSGKDGGQAVLQKTARANDDR